VARIEKATNELVGQYNITEHNAYHGLWYGRLNHVFELAGALYQPRPKPVKRKRKVKSCAVVTALVVRKTFGKRGRGEKSIHSKTQTSAQELALAKPLKHSMKFAAKSSGLSAVEKASLAGVDAAGKKPKRVLNLFGSDSSVSGSEPVPSEMSLGISGFKRSVETSSDRR
jgi:hypothetical protein